MSAGQVDKLLSDGIKAARAGDKEQARQLLQQVVEIDQYNERGWFWLASVVESDAERRTCLGNVVLINPDNQRAQVLLEQLEEGGSGSQRRTPTSPNRRIGIVVGGALAVVILAILVLNLLGGGGDDTTTDDNATADQAAANGAGLPNGGQDDIATATETVPPPPTITPFATLPPAVNTATATATSTQVPRAIETVPPGFFSGRLLIASGWNFASNEHIPLFVMTVNSAGIDLVPAASSDILGYAASTNANNTRYVFERYNRGQQVVTLQIATINGSELITLSDLWNRDPAIAQQFQPDWSPDGSSIIFTGKNGFDRQSDLRLLVVPDLTDDEAVTELTTFVSPEVDESWPLWSPDGREILYVADTTLSGNNTVDLRIFNPTTGQIRQLTNDGNAIRESMPDWGGPNNAYVIYSGSNGNGSDIWIAPIANAQSIEELLLPAPTEEPEAPIEEATEAGTEPTEEVSEGSTIEPEEAAPELTSEIPTAILTEVVEIAEPVEIGSITEPQVLINYGTNDIMPHWSPDGRYIVFSSDANDDRFDIFVYDFQTGEVYAVLLPDSDQLNDGTRDIVYDWLE